MAHSIRMYIGDFGPTLRRRLALVAGLAAVCSFALQLAGVGQSDVPTRPVQPVASDDAAQAAHCSQFIELARAKFGPEWKRRLDPRDTACAQQIQQAWEQDWQPRETPPELVLQPKTMASTAPPLNVAPPEMKPAQASKTYSLAAVTRANARPTSATGQSVGSAGQADAAGPKDANHSSDSREHERPMGAAREDDDDEGGMVDDGEQGYDARSFSSSDEGVDDDGVEDDQPDTRRALDNEQVGRRGRYDDDVLHPRDDDSERDEDDGEFDENDDVDGPTSSFPGDHEEELGSE